jgi:hypothetical protein
MDMEFRMVLRKRQMTLQEGVRQAVGMWLSAYAKVDGYGVKAR